MPRRRKTENSEEQIQSETRPSKSRTKKRGGSEILHAALSGEWADAEVLKQNALRTSKAGKDLTVDLADLTHLDASALQILLAIQIEQRNAGRQFKTTNCSADLAAWFDLAGAADFTRSSPEQEG